MIHELVNHLGQSTLFACVIGLCARGLRKNRAAVRHGLWVAASVKFLLPFSPLIGLGSQVHWRKSPAVDERRPDVMRDIHDPIRNAAEPAGLLRQTTPSGIAVIVFGVWLCGFSANSLAWWRRWRKVRFALRGALRVPLDLPIPVLDSSMPLEPGVFGILRPFLLLPAGLREHLTAEQFEAILAHEMCHVRRRDNLTSAIHMLVETLFWFDPVVWWIRARLIEERERACDEAVLAMGSDPRDYAQGIVTVCRFYLKSPLVCVSGVTGADLKRRVEAIMLNRIADEISLTKKLLLATAGGVMVTAPLMVGIVEAPPIRAQEPAKPVPQLIATSSLPEFDVASIKVSSPDSNLRVDFAPGGKLYIANATLRFLIKIAYDIGDDQLAGGPPWVASKRFDLAATPDRPVAGDPKNMAPDQILAFHKPTRLRLQRLLTDRFQLELRRGSIPMPIFALVLGKGGSKKLRPAKSTGAPQLNGKFGNGRLHAIGVDMTTLAHFLSEGQTGRPVVDLTGLTGRFDFDLEWTPDPTLNPLAPDAQPADMAGVSIFTAVQQQLGLKLEGRTGDADRLMIVHAALPSEN